ncbi:hypothetical protein M0R45_034868 [Rubus argutus]|uniref:Uncharacterized protein n=1 Tax=Rubus argutus TaxID=59490 RepID=A0AAW1VTW4_RUBAR
MHYGSNLKQVWKGTKHLPFLKILDLSHSHGLTKPMDECVSLEKVTFQSLSCVPEMMFLLGWLSFQLVEIEHWYKLEAIGRVDVEMINLLGLCNLEPNRMEMQTPDYLPEPPWKSRDCMNVVYSARFFQEPIRGLNIYCVYALRNSCESKFLVQRPVIIVVWNKSKGLKWIYAPSWHGIASKEQDMIWLSHWKFGNQLEAGDHVTASVHGTTYEVKEWGIRIVHKEEDKMSRQLYNSYTRDDNCYDGQDHPDNDVNAEMIGIGGYLSEFYQTKKQGVSRLSPTGCLKLKRGAALKRKRQPTMSP